MATRVLEVKITGDSIVLERAMLRAEKSGAAAASGLEAAGLRMQRAGEGMSRTGRTLTRGLTLPVVALGGLAVKSAIDFEKSMRNVNSIAQLPEPAFRRLNAQVEELAGPVAQAPVTLSEGLYDLVSSGFDAKESLVILKASAKGATAGLTTTETSTKGVAAALNAYRRPAKDAGKVTDDLFETVNRGVVSFEELAGSVGMVYPAASALGVNTKEVGAAIATLTKEGQSGETAITNINQAMTSFIKPSKAMKDAIRELGFENSESLINAKGFQGAVESVVRTTHGSKEAVGELFRNVRAMRAVFGLTGENVRSAGADLRAFGDDTGATAKVFKEQSKSLAFQWNRLKAEATVLGIQLGNQLVPVLRTLGHEVAGAVHWFSGLPPGVQSSVVKFGLLAAALGPVLRLTGGIVTGLGKMIELGGKAARALELIPPAGVGAGGGVVPVGVGAGAGRVATTTEQSVGAYGEKQALRDVGLIGGGTAAGSLKGKIADMGRSLGRSVLGVAGGYILAEVGVHGLKALGVGDPTEGQGIAKSLVHGFNTDRVASTEKEALAQYNNQEKAFAAAMVSIQLHQLAGLGKIKADLHQGLEALTGEWKTNKVAWRIQTVEAMQQTIAAIKGGVRAGVIPVKQGKTEIQHLLGEIKIVKGADPLGLASSFTKEFKKAGGITQGGINDLIHDFKLMPKGAREAAQDSVLEQVNAWAKGHPKIEAQVDVFRKNLENKFGRTNTRISHGVSGFIDTVGNLFASLAESVTGSINIMGVNVSGILKQLGITKAINFTVNVAKTGVNAVKGVAGMLPGNAQGGAVRVPGSGVQDSVPLAVNGAMSAVVAPGEDLVVLNRHQRPLVDQALANEYGVAGLPGFFSAFDRPHYMAKGGQLTHPQIAGGTAPMRHMGQAMVDRVYQAEQAYIQAHRPKGGAGVAGYVGPPASMHQLGNSGWVDAHTLAVTAFLDKKFGLTMSSGFRSVAHNAEIGGAPGSLHTHGSPANPGATDSVGPMASMQGYIAFAKQHVAGLKEAMVDNYAGLGANAHLGFFARGGRINRIEHGLHTALQSIWPHAAHLYGRSGKSQMPLTTVKPLAGAGSTVGHSHVFLTPASALGVMGMGDLGGRRTLLHEWAHVFQKHGLKKWEAEGGATAFSAWATPQIFGASSAVSGRGITRKYAHYQEMVLKRKGWPWIKHGQFRGFTKGGFATKDQWSLDDLSTLAAYVSMDHPGLMGAVAWAESHGNAAAKNPESTATGLWQVLGGSTDPIENAREAASLLASQGLGAWAASQAAWAGAQKGHIEPKLLAVLKGGSAAGGGGKKFKPQFGLQGGVHKDQAPKSYARTPVSLPPLGPTPLLPSAKALPKSIKSLLRAPGLSYAGKVGIGEFALQQAEGTDEFHDDVAALRFQEELLERRERDLKHDLKKVRGDLKLPQSGKARAKSLARAHALEDQLRETRGDIAGVHTSLREAKPTEKDRADLQLARAESTSGKQDDIEALKHLEDLAKKELERAEHSGDPREIAEATRELKSAADALREATPSEEDFANRDLALAELTESTEDDKAAMEHLLAIAEAELANALATPDPRDDIESAHKVKEMRDSLKAIQEATNGQLEQEVKSLREEMEKNRHIAESEAATSAAVVRRALTDLIAEQLGARVTARHTAGNGGQGTLAGGRF